MQSSAPPSFSLTDATPDGEGLDQGQLLTVQSRGCAGLGACLERTPGHANTQDMLQAFETHCHPTRLPIHRQIRKAHLCPPPDRRCLAGESPWGPGHSRTSSGCLPWVRSAQHSIRPKAGPAHLEPCSSHLFQPPPRSRTWGQKGLGRPRVDICSNSPSQASLSLAQQSLGLHCLGPRGRWALLPPLSLGKDQEGPGHVGARSRALSLSRSLSLSLALSVSRSQGLSGCRGQPPPGLARATLLSTSTRACQPASFWIEPCPQVWRKMGVCEDGTSMSVCLFPL